jgi:hypothetical protein
MVQAIQTINFYEGRMHLPTSLNPRDWHPRAEVIVLKGEVPDEVLQIIVEMALEMGWGFNPLTRTFYRLD